MYFVPIRDLMILVGNLFAPKTDATISLQNFDPISTIF